MQLFQDRPTSTDLRITLGSNWAKQIGSVGFLVAGVALRIVTPFLGTLTLLAGSVSFVWSSLRREDSVENSYKQKRALDLVCVGVLFCIPWVGVLVAGIFAKKRLPHVMDTGVHGGVEALTEIVCYPLSGLIQRAFFPLSRANVKLENSPHKQVVLCDVRLGNARSRRVEMILYDQDRESRIPRAVVMFPKRNETGISDDAQAGEYSHHFDVYKITLGGYPKQDGPDQNVETTESTCIQDANAVINTVKGLGYKKIAVHGAGLGCVPALVAAQLHPDVVKAVVLDRGFTRAKDVFANAVRNRLQPLGLGRWVPTSILRGVVGSAFPYGMEVAGVPNLTTNQMDNLARVQDIPAPIGCIEATEDLWMSRSLLPTPEDNPESFSRDLLRVHRGKDDAIRTLQGGHQQALEQGVLVGWLNQVMPLHAEKREGGKQDPVEHNSSTFSTIQPVHAQTVTQDQSRSSAGSTWIASPSSSETSSSVVSSSSSAMDSLLLGTNPWSSLSSENTILSPSILSDPDSGNG